MNEALRKMYRIGSIVLSCITFLFTILTLAQFIYVQNLYYFVISFLVHLVITFLYYIVFHYISKKRGYIIFNKSDFKYLKIGIYGIRVISCCLILTMVHVGNLFEVQEVALSSDPIAITYMVFVFILLFLEFFSIFLWFVEKDINS